MPKTHRDTQLGTRKAYVTGGGAENDRLLRRVFSDNVDLESGQHDSCSTFAYCCAYFSKTACRVAAGSAASVGVSYLLNSNPSTMAFAALLGAVGAVVSRCGDDCCDATRMVDAKMNANDGDGQGPCRQIGEIITPMPGPHRSFTG